VKRLKRYIAENVRLHPTCDISDLCIKRREQGRTYASFYCQQHGTRWCTIKALAKQGCFRCVKCHKQLLQRPEFLKQWLIQYTTTSVNPNVNCFDFSDTICYQLPKLTMMSFVCTKVDPETNEIHGVQWNRTDMLCSLRIACRKCRYYDRRYWHIDSELYKKLDNVLVVPNISGIVIEPNVDAPVYDLLYDY
jgi:hypothetical protein